MVADAYKGLYEVAVVISNDSDLREALRIVRQDLKLRVVLLYPEKPDSDNPRDKSPNPVLKNNSDEVKPIRPGVLEVSQFPEVLKD